MRRVVSLAVVSLLCAAAAWAGDIKVTTDSFRFGVKNYFRGNAENVALASYGEKKTPVGKGNYLAVQNTVGGAKLAEVKVGTAGPFDMDWSSVSATTISGSASVKYLAADGNVGGTLSVEKGKNARLKLVKFFFDEAALQKLLNQEADGARRYLADEGNDGRIVSEVWVVMEAELAQTLTTSGSLKISGGGTAGVTKIEATGGVSSSKTTTTSVSLPQGTTFAYGLMKVKNWSKGKERVEGLEDDQAGLN